MLDGKQQVWLTWVPEAEVFEGEAATNLLTTGLPQVGSRVEGWTATEEEVQAFRNLDRTSRTALQSTVHHGDDALKDRNEMKEFQVWWC